MLCIEKRQFKKHTSENARVVGLRVLETFPIPNGGFLLVSLNPQAIAWLKLHPERIDLEGLALNAHPEAIP